MPLLLSPNFHSFISANIGFLSCARKLLGQRGTQNSQNLLSGLTWQWGNTSDKQVNKYINKKRSGSGRRYEEK